VLFSFILFCLGILILELSIRAAFSVTGRYSDFGYSEESKKFSPYVGVANRKETGRDKYGFRLSSKEKIDRNLEDKVCEFRVFVLGGSTVDGKAEGTIDETLPARLQSLLDERIRPEGYEIAVINAGVGGYVSYQSLMQDIMYIRYSLHPDLIIYFDGSNDSVGNNNVSPKSEFPGVNDNLHRVTENLFSSANKADSTLGLLDSLLRVWANHSALVFLMHKSINDPQSWVRWYARSAVLNDPDDQLNSLIERHVNRYMFNVSIALGLANSEVPVAYFLQPALLKDMYDVMSASEKKYFQSGTDNSEAFYGYDRGVAKQLFYDRAREEFARVKSANNNEFAIVEDLSRLFEKKTARDTLFVDHVHYSNEGRQIIAKEIFDLVSAMIEVKLSMVDLHNSCKAN